MKTSTILFYVGDLQCMSVFDGVHAYPEPGRLLFPDAPEEYLAKELRNKEISPKHWHTWTSDYTCLLVDTGTHRILIDSGAGAFLESAGQAPGNLGSVGYGPDDIDMVVLSHAHPDHLGAVSAFPEADIVMHGEEWRFWTSNPALPRLPDAFRNTLLQMICPILDSVQERVWLVESDTEIVPGLRLIEAPGHTPGHMAVFLESCGKHLMYTGDAMLHPLHVENPQWSAMVDVLPDLAMFTRQRLLRCAVETRALLLGFHFPFPGLGRAEPKGESWAWIASEPRTV